MNIDESVRTPDEIFLQFCAISFKIGYPLTLTELNQFRGVISDELIQFVLDKQTKERLND
jgi:hypothetical protein